MIVRETTMTSVSSAAIDALGFVEVRGLAAAIETADAMLKSADVRLLRQLLRDPALTTITVEGSLGACSAAVDAGRAAAQRMDGFVAATVMGRPANDTADFVLRLAEAGRAPFAPSGRFEGLSIEHLELFNAEDRFWAQYRTDKDATVFGANWAAFLRASIFPTLAAALDGGVSDPRGTEFVDRLEAGVAAQLAAAPEQMSIPLAKLVLEKRPSA